LYVATLVVLYVATLVVLYVAILVVLYVAILVVLYVAILVVLYVAILVVLYDCNANLYGVEMVRSKTKHLTSVYPNLLSFPYPLIGFFIYEYPRPSTKKFFFIFLG
jgi:hypothetical protein